jgi:hypothetical protein
VVTAAMFRATVEFVNSAVFATLVLPTVVLGR